MFLLRFSLLLGVLPFLDAYPLAAQVKSDLSSGLDPADYPDLTNGLSDAEVESTLNGLSLDDLNALNKLLDDAGNGPFDLEASLRGRHRSAKKQHYDEIAEPIDEDMDAALNSGKQSFDDGCHDEDDADRERDQCTERPKCKRPTTRRCTPTTRRCATTSCKSLDGFLDIHLDTSKFGGKSKSKAVEECDPEDTMCLKRIQQRSKQLSNAIDFPELAMDQEPNNMDSLERLAAQAHRDESLKLHKQLDGWNGKDDVLPDTFNMDYGKLTNADTAVSLNDFKQLPKLGEDESQPSQSDEEPKQAELELAPYERQQLARVSNEQLQQQQADDYKQAAEEAEADASALDENMQLNAAQVAAQERVGDELEAAEPMPLVNEGDSFIAKNAREPLRYVIQTEDGIIRSDNEPGEHQLRSDKEHSEMLNYESLQLPGQNQLQSSKRFKRDNKKTDDAPEIPNESYLKKLMDSFPRDQGSQSNLNMAIRQANRAHFRVKRS